MKYYGMIKKNPPTLNISRKPIPHKEDFYITIEARDAYSAYEKMNDKLPQGIYKFDIV